MGIISREQVGEVEIAVEPRGLDKFYGGDDARFLFFSARNLYANEARLRGLRYGDVARGNFAEMVPWLIVVLGGV